MKTLSLPDRIGLAAIVVVIAAASAGAQTNSVQTFNSPTCGYSVSVPADWRRASNAEVQGMLTRVRLGPDTQDIDWEAFYRAPAAAGNARYPYVIFQVKPYPPGSHPTEAELEKAVAAMSGNNFKTEAGHSGDAFVKSALDSASLEQAKYDPVNHVMTQDLNMNLPGIGPIQGVVVHHFGRTAIVSVMCYDRKGHFPVTV